MTAGNEKTKGIRIALVCNEPDAIQSFHRHLSSPGVRVAPFSSIQQFQKEHESMPDLSGTVIDLHTGISSSTHEKDFIRSIKKESKRPLLELAIPNGEASLDQLATLKRRYDSFLGQAFEFLAETNLRAFPRKQRVLKVKILQSAEAGAPSVRAVTSDFSAGGCFIVSFGDWTSLRELYLEFNESGIVIPCRVAWDRKWEKVDNRFPGFGAQFKDLQGPALQEINRLLEE